ncbi:MAG: hypothetical protein ABS81_01790 [Pseudonocardia sp. SCN 72-86]|nr:MAG: hypothetical protein ABS81_01790 [Pseudonocardia sp. SCN 72-86]
MGSDTDTGTAATVAVGWRDGILEVTLDRPSRANALSAAVVDELGEALTSARARDARAVVLRGRGRHFCAGFDVEGALESTEGDLLLRFVRIEQVLQVLRAMSCPTFALVHGKAVGAGADIVAACSHRVLAPDATLRFPGFRFGVALGTRHLSATVGREHARRLLLTGEEIGAQDALRTGLATEIVDVDDFVGFVERELGAIADLDDAAVAAILGRTCTLRDDAGDMAALVASLARPGLHERLSAYLGAHRG